MNMKPSSSNPSKKYAIFHFQDDNGVAILETSKIQDYEIIKGTLNNKDFDFSKAVIVKYGKENTPFAANILRFGDKPEELHNARDRFVKGFHVMPETPVDSSRQRVRKRVADEDSDYDPESDAMVGTPRKDKGNKQLGGKGKRNVYHTNDLHANITKKLKAASGDQLQAMDRQVVPASGSGENNWEAFSRVVMAENNKLREEMTALKAEVTEIKQENANYKAAFAIFKSLPELLAAVNEAKGAVATITAAAVTPMQHQIPSGQVEEAERQLVAQSANPQQLAAALRCLSQEPEKKVKELMAHFWSRPYMASHSLTGQNPGNKNDTGIVKEKATPTKMEAILGYVGAVCPTLPKGKRILREAAREKFQFEAKAMRRREDEDNAPLAL